MAQDKEFSESKLKEQKAPGAAQPQKLRPTMTRRDFLKKGNSGAVAVGVMSGAGFAALVPEPATATQSTPADPVTSRRVTLDIDGKEHARFKGSSQHYSRGKRR